jgi:hypothetical protein
MTLIGEQEDRGREVGQGRRQIDCRVHQVEKGALAGRAQRPDWILQAADDDPGRRQHRHPQVCAWTWLQHEGPSLAGPVALRLGSATTQGGLTLPALAHVLASALSVAWGQPGSTPCLASNFANMPIRNSGDGGTVWASVEAIRAPRARPGSTEDRGVDSSILSLATTFAS